MPRLDARAKATGRQGVAAARAALQAGRRRQGADPVATVRPTRGPRQPESARPGAG